MVDPNKSSLSEKWLLVKGKIQHIHPALSKSSASHTVYSQVTQSDGLFIVGEKNLKDCEIYSLSTVSLILTPKWIWNNHTKEKHFLTEKETNKQVLLRAVCDLANQWESKNTILSIAYGITSTQVTHTPKALIASTVCLNTVSHLYVRQKLWLMIAMAIPTGLKVGIYSQRTGFGIIL